MVHPATGNTKKQGDRILSTAIGMIGALQATHRLLTFKRGGRIQAKCATMGWPAVAVTDPSMSTLDVSEETGWVVKEVFPEGAGVHLRSALSKKVIVW
jgi:hypothetical protein